MNAGCPPTDTPWGPAQDVTDVIPGIWFVSTASHGGYWLSPERQQQMPQPCRHTSYSPGQWYEEDMDCLLVFAAFYDELTSEPEAGPRLLATWPTRDALIDSLTKYDTGGRGYFGAERIDALRALVTP